MSALDPFIANPASSVPSEVAAAISASNRPPSPDAEIAQLFELADSRPLRGGVDRNPDICELLAYAQGGLFYPISPRDFKASLPSGESDPAVTLDCSRGESIDSPPLFLSNPSFEFTQSVLERGGVA